MVTDYLKIFKDEILFLYILVLQLKFIWLIVYQNCATFLRFIYTRYFKHKKTAQPCLQDKVEPSIRIDS